METPKKSLFALLGDRGSAHENADCVAAVDELVGHTDNIPLVKAYEAFLYRVKIMMEHTRNMTNVYEKQHVRAAADQMGFEVPQVLPSVFTHDTNAFSDVTRTIFLSHGVYYPKFMRHSLAVLQTVFEALELGNVVSIPVETGNTFQLDSPNGVSTVLFQMNWDVVPRGDDESEDFDPSEIEYTDDLVLDDEDCEQPEVQDSYHDSDEAA
jgi:hypothetical protein